MLVAEEREQTRVLQVVVHRSTPALLTANASREGLQWVEYSAREGPGMLNGQPVGAVVFDAYGTLLDVFSVERACAAVTVEPLSLVTLWRQKQLEYSWQRALMNQYADFWQVTGEALDYAAARLGVSLDAAARERLREAWL